MRVEAQLRRTGGMKILFGHQSVGHDIVRGLEELRDQCSGTPFCVVETRDPAGYSGPGFHHCRIGRNTDPDSKIRDFESLMDGKFGEWAEIAFPKFCYVDIKAESDVDGIFRRYQEAMSRLERRHAPVTFLHVTVPVVKEPGIAGALFRRVARRGNSRREDNAARRRFNEMLVREYRGSGRVFDLASIEADLMGEGFSDDGCHLNALGRRAAAEGLIALLSTLGPARAGTTWT